MKAVSQSKDNQVESVTYKNTRSRNRFKKTFNDLQTGIDVMGRVTILHIYKTLHNTRNSSHTTIATKRLTCPIESSNYTMMIAPIN